MPAKKEGHADGIVVVAGGEEVGLEAAAVVAMMEEAAIGKKKITMDVTVAVCHRLAMKNGGGVSPKPCGILMILILV